MSCWPIPSLLLQLTVIILLGFGHGKCGGGGWRRGYRQLRAPGASRSGARAPQRLRRGGPGSGGTFFSPSSGAIFCPTRSTAVLAFATLQFGQAMLALATLSFLGYGTPPPVPEWGLLIAEGRNYLSTAWWLTTFPGLAVVAVVLAANRLSRQWSGARP
ncbi:dipeptide transport system permease DppC [Klebsiella pneumoniae]|uniref:Dipeptide transport system permease DppC n=1 Tax=Klebsiella pneumoniae TaxID=573 RepID=A0A377XB98_KLEPN|nr:dipeptide transport system permease DppC [Klebsiella pneumoniae]